jgi:hypothetical protein
LFLNDFKISQLKMDLFNKEIKKEDPAKILEGEWAYLSQYPKDCKKYQSDCIVRRKYITKLTSKEGIY